MSLDAEVGLLGERSTVTGHAQPALVSNITYNL
jgi:hypothetical protein